MSIDKGGSRYNSLQQFQSFFKVKDNHPSTTNLYSVHFTAPHILRRNLITFAGANSDVFDSTRDGDLSKALDYYAKNVNLPSKQVTTGSLVNVGSPIKYATGSAHSQINITFQIQRSQLTRNFFERWLTRMSSDANQYTEFFRDYTCPKLRIHKWERGGGELALNDPDMLAQLRASNISPLMARLNEITAVWELENVFPYNIGSIQLNNDSARVMDLTVGFYYERYRFHVKDQFDDPGRQSDTFKRLALDNNIQPDRQTMRNSGDKAFDWASNQEGAWDGY